MTLIKPFFYYLTVFIYCSLSIAAEHVGDFNQAKFTKQGITSILF